MKKGKRNWLFPKLRINGRELSEFFSLIMGKIKADYFPRTSLEFPSLYSLLNKTGYFLSKELQRREVSKFSSVLGEK